MSPTENDLRAALHDGEGDGVDPNRIIFRAQRERAARRSKLLNAAAAVIVVVGIGGGGAWLLAQGNGDEKASNSGAAGGGNSAALDHGTSAYGAARAPGAAPQGSSAATCPATMPRYPQPAGAASGSLFDRPVTSALVCSYGTTTALSTGKAGTPTGITLTGADATALVDSLEQSKVASGQSRVMCPDYRMADEQAIAIFAFKADGSSAGSVTTVLGRPSCAVVVRSAKGVREGWTPPAQLLPAMAKLHPQPVASPSK